MKRKKDNLLKKIFMLRSPFYKTWWIDVLLLLVSVFAVVGIPIIINESLLAENDYVYCFSFEFCKE